ncbi:MAG: sulfotransferase [Pseudomonadota bacterium]
MANDPRGDKAKDAPPPFDVPQLLRWAARDTGEEDVSFLENDALHALCTSLAETTQLHFIGRSRAQKLLLANLIKRVRLRQYRARHPEIGEIELKRPVFLIGPPRTGTTFLHRLLAEDPAVRAPRLWETLQPPPAQPEWREDPQYFEQDYRVEMSRKAIGARKRFTPGLSSIHSSAVDVPEECYGLLETSLLSHSFMFYGPVTGYLDWLDGRSHAEWVDAYRLYADQLRLLQWWYPGDFWVVKTPFHLWAMEAIFEVFPDALVVQQGRDPVSCVASYCSLSAEAYKPTMLKVDKEQVGRQALRYLGDAVNRNVVARRQLPAERFIDIDYPDLIADPMDTAQRIYAAMDRELTPAAREAMEAYLAKQRESHKKGGHRYSLSDYGLEESVVRDAFADYNAMVRGA